MTYLTGGAQLMSALVVQKRGRAPVLFHEAMERDEAARTGLQTRNLGAYRITDLIRQTGGDLVQAQALRLQALLKDQDLTSGRVLVCGQQDAGSTLALFTALRKLAPALEFVGEMGDSLLMRARMTKDSREVEHIRQVGQLTVDVVRQAADFLSAHLAQEGVLIEADGRPLTVGTVKSRISLWLAERGAETPEGFIFATGRDAAVPHSAGNPDAPLRLGQTIVFDIFPSAAGGGYCYDFTRTWCLGYAPPDAQALWEDVYAVYRQVREAMESGGLCSSYQALACELFARRGHATIRENQETEHGYVHGLGHGVGLNVQERPSFRMDPGNEDRLEPGTVFTLEPGLYYPERGLGVRLEDTLWVRPDGKIEALVEYPWDLVLPVRSI
jgi:Xaa-Pro aminopeptidase